MIPNIYVTFELLMQVAFVAEEIWGFMLEPARRHMKLLIDTYVFDQYVEGNNRCNRLLFLGYMHMNLPIDTCFFDQDVQICSDRYLFILSICSEKIAY